MAGMTPTYPKRPAFFANKAIRAAIKTCVANEHGQDVFCLLCVVAHTEDAAHYRRPVTFYSGQLMPLIGILSESTFKRVRQRAVDSGWLVYIPGAKRKPASYFVTIPERAQGLDDLPTDEGITEWSDDEQDSGSHSGSDSGSPMTHNPSGIDSGSNTGSPVTQNPSNIRPESVQNVDLMWTPIIPIPNPVPIPEETPLPPKGGVGGKSTKKNAITSLDGIKVPEPLDTPEHRAVLGQWLAYRVDLGKPYRAACAVQSLLAQWAKDPDLLAEAVRTSMANQWQGLFVPDQGRRSRAGPLPAGPGLLFPEDRKTGTGEF